MLLTSPGFYIENQKARYYILAYVSLLSSKDLVVFACFGYLSVACLANTTTSQYAKLSFAQDFFFSAIIIYNIGGNIQYIIFCNENSWLQMIIGCKFSVH